MFGTAGINLSFSMVRVTDDSRLSLLFDFKFEKKCSLHGTKIPHCKVYAPVLSLGLV
jgi:hypothetical protein